MRSARLADQAAGVPPGGVFLATTVALLVLTQRLALPLGASAQLPVAVPLMLAMVTYGLAFGHLVVSRTLAMLLGLSLVTLGLLTVVSLARGAEPSATSFALYVAIYLPAVCVATSPDAARFALRFFVDLMSLAASVGLALFALQYAGLAYADHLGEVLPTQLVLQGYNTADPIRFDSPIYRSNGVIFLEPSFFSLFLGLAAVVAIVLRHRTLLLPLLLSALLTTVAGNGVFLLVAAMVWILLVGPRRRLIAMVPAVVVAVVVVSATPLAELFLSRSSEVGQENSSASLRFVQPYTELLPRYVDSLTHALVGSGAGAAQRLIVEQVGSESVIVPVVAKLLVEYGTIGTIAVLVFLVYLTARRAVVAPWAGGLLPAYFVVNASLLQATLAATTYLFCSLLVPRGPTADQRSSDTTDGRITSVPATANP